MDKRILLPTDFSNNALNAARYALDLYADKKCIFYFLNAYQGDVFSINSASNLPIPEQPSYKVEKRNSERSFEKLMEVLWLRSENPNHTYETISTYDTLIDGTKKMVDKKDIDLIIMGTRGANGTRTDIFGTNAVSIMEGITECPVLAIPQNLIFTPPKEIVFPTDYKSTFKRRELKYMINIAQAHNGHIRVLHIKRSDKLTMEQQDNKELLASIFTNVKHSFHELKNSAVHAGINAFISSRPTDMIAFINHKRNFFTRMMSKPLVKELGYHSKVPVLVLKDRN